MTFKPKFTVVITICTIILGIIAIQEYSFNISQSGVSSPINSFTVSPIYIDDTDPNHNWDSFIATHPWCTGSGTPSDPYKLRDLTIDAQGGSSCIFIQNSEKIFHIEDCVLLNTDSLDESAGIKCINVTWGFIMNCEIYQNSLFGIEAIESSIILIHNSVHDNEGWGVYLGGCDQCLIVDSTIINNSGIGIEAFHCQEITISSNDIAQHYLSGISLIRTNNSLISGNIISDHIFDGIYMFESRLNSIQTNSISSSEESGILLEWYSHDNNITGNVLQDNIYCISIGESCLRNQVSDNDPSEVYSFDDTPHPSPDPPDGENPSISGYFGFVVITMLFIFVMSFITIRKQLNHP